MPDLKVTVGADIDAYQQGLAQAAQATKQFSNDASQSLAQAAQSTDQLGGAAMSASMRFYTMRSGVSAARDGVMAFTLGGQAAERSLMAMGHHITSLVNETGSFKAAMGALASSLWGPGGIILGITLAVELFDKLGKAHKKGKDEAKEYAETLSSVDRAMLKGAQSGQAEIVRLKILYDATQNHSLSLKDRNLAYDELEKKYPQWFTNSDREKTLLGENITAYTRLANAILSAAYAKAAEDEITKNQNRFLEDQKKITDLRKQEIEARNALNKQSGYSKNNLNVGFAGTQQTDYVAIDAENKLNDLTREHNNLLTDQSKIQTENNDLAAMAAKYEEKAGYKTGPEESHRAAKVKAEKDAYQLLEEEVKKMSEALNTSITKDYLDKQGKESQNTKDLTEKYQALLIQLNSINQARKDAIDAADREAAIKSQGSVFGPAKRGDAPDLGKMNIKEDPKQLAAEAKAQAGAIIAANDTILSSVDEAYERGNISIRAYLQQKYFLEESNLNAERSLYAEGTKQYGEYTARMANLTKQYEDKVKKLNDTTKTEKEMMQEITQVVGHGLVSAFESAMNGSQSFVQSMVGFIERLIEKLIAAAAAAAILSVLLKSTGFGAAIGISGEASSFSSLFGSLSGFKAFADGGVVTGPTRALIGEAGPEAVIPLSRFNEVVGGNNGGGGHFTVEHKVQGSDLLLVINRATKSQNRRS